MNRDKYVYNMKHREPMAECPLGLTGFVSFNRLEEIFRETGEINSNDHIRAFAIEEHGIKYVVDHEPRR